MTIDKCCRYVEPCFGYEIKMTFSTSLCRFNYSVISNRGKILINPLYFNICLWSSRHSVYLTSPMCYWLIITYLYLTCLRNPNALYDLINLWINMINKKVCSISNRSKARIHLFHFVLIDMGCRLYKYKGHHDCIHAKIIIFSPLTTVTYAIYATLTKVKSQYSITSLWLCMICLGCKQNNCNPDSGVLESTAFAIIFTNGHWSIVIYPTRYG